MAESANLLRPGSLAALPQRFRGGTLCPSNGGRGLVSDWSNAMGAPRSPEPLGTPTIHANAFDASNPDQLDADVIASVVALDKFRCLLASVWASGRSWFIIRLWPTTCNRK